MRLAFITLSGEGSLLIPQLGRAFGEIDCYVHESVGAVEATRSFSQIAVLTREIFTRYQALIYAAPCGVVVRSLSECAASKLTDPAVVVMDVGARWAISLLSGHEGGANELAMRVANVFDAEPVVTTTTEAVKNLIVGVGCRRGVECSLIVDAIHESLKLVSMPITRVRLMASASIKNDEVGLLQAAEKLNIPIRFISMEQIGQCQHVISQSEFVRKSVGVPAVAEPAALLAGRRTTLLLPKTIYSNITVAIAKESFTS